MVAVIGRRRVVLGGLVAACATALSAQAGDGSAFVDPLDAPAAPSRIASQAPMMAAVRTPAGRLVACGRHGIVLLSDDGESWRQARVPVSTDLVAVAFPTARDGWAVGHGGVVLHSADGGENWSRQLDGRQIPDLLIAHFKAKADAGDEAAARALADAQRYKEDGPGRPLLAVWFRDARHGLVVGAYNLALRTADGGKSWSVAGDRFDNPQGMHLYGIAAVDRALWVAGEQGLLLKGALPGEGGDDAFVRVPTPYNGSFFGVTGQGPTVMAYGLRGNAVRSRDGGATWETLSTGTQSTLTGGTALPRGGIALVSAGGELLVVPDAGRPAAGAIVKVQPAMPLYAAAAADAQRVMVVGARGVVLQRLADKVPVKESR